MKKNNEPGPLAPGEKQLALGQRAEKLGIRETLNLLEEEAAAGDVAFNIAERELTEREPPPLPPHLHNSDHHPPPPPPHHHPDHHRRPPHEALASEMREIYNTQRRMEKLLVEMISLLDLRENRAPSGA